MTTFEKTVKYVAMGFAGLLAVGIIVGILKGVLVLISVVSGNGGKTIDSNQVFQADRMVNSIRIDNSVGDICFYETDGDEIRIDAKKVSEEYTCELSENGTITIKNKNTKSFIFNFFNSDSNINIYIPKDFELKSVSIDTGVGDIKIENVTLSQLTVDNGVGDFKMAETSVMLLKADMGIGDVKAEDCKMENVELNNGIGDIKLNLTGDIENYDVEIDSGIGDKKINGKGRKHYTSETSKYEIECDNGIGDVKIEIQK